MFCSFKHPRHFYDQKINSDEYHLMINTIQEDSSVLDGF